MRCPVTGDTGKAYSIRSARCSGVIFPCKYARPAFTSPGSLPLSLQSTLSIDAFTC